MNSNLSLSFVVPVSDETIFENNFMSSPMFKKKYICEIIKQNNFASASAAYNDGIDRSSNNIIVFCHQDMVFPDNWIKDVSTSIDQLNRTDPNWGVIGCYGEAKHGKGMKGYGYLYCNGNKKILGNPLEEPVPVETLDEVVLILKKSSGLRFDRFLPHFHLYGADICMIAKSKGKNSYAISAFCLHNTSKVAYLPDEFLECYKYLKDKWINNLPIRHTCITIKKHDALGLFIYKYFRRLKYRMNRLSKRNYVSEPLRSKEPLTLLRELQVKYDIQKRSE